MRLGIIGTHSVGKTTLAHAVAERYGLPYLRSDTARDIGSLLNTGKRLDEFSSKEQWQLQQSFLARAAEIQESNGPFITDCCSLTCDAYTHLLLGEATARIPDYEAFIARAHESARSLTKIFYVPPEADLELDGFRPESEELRTAIDERVRETLKSFPYTILTGDLERRVEQVGLATGLVQKSTWSNYIAFEGIPGTGKTTQIQRLVAALRARGMTVHVCERYGTDALKAELQELYRDPVKNREVLLQRYVASFREQFERNEVRERLGRGEVVIADRQKFTAIALLSALGLPLAQLYRETRDLPTPGRVVLLDAEPEVAAIRRLREPAGNPLKTEVAFQRKVQEQYRWLSRHHEEFYVVDANRDVERVHQDLMRSLGYVYGFNQAKEEVAGMARRYAQQGTRPWGVTQIGMDLQYQIGSLSKLLLQRDGYVHDHGLTEAEIQSLIALDIADIISLALSLADALDIDPNEAFVAQLQSDIEKIRERTL